MLAGGGLAGLAAQHRRVPQAAPAPDIAEGLPPKVGHWQQGESGSVVLPPEDAYTRSVYDQIVARYYFAEGAQTVSILVAYGLAQSYAAQLHRPEVCYPASNFRIERNGEVPLDIGKRRLPANYLLAARDRRRDAVLYWTRIGASYPQEIWQQRWAIARSAFDRSVQDGIVVRMSLASTSPRNDIDVLSRFARGLYGQLLPKYQELLFGAMMARPAAV